MQVYIDIFLSDLSSVRVFSPVHFFLKKRGTPRGGRTHLEARQTHRRALGHTPVPVPEDRRQP